MSVSISLGNRKLGRIPSVSVTPILSCQPNVPCYKYCYARKAYRMYPKVRECWDGNYDLAVRHPEQYFSEINDYIVKKNPSHFRWHVAGDILSQHYFNNMNAVAEKNPNTKFLAFTKHFKLDYSKAVDNMTVRHSYWTGWGNYDKNTSNLLAWYQDGKEDRIPENAFECQGSCIVCRSCWEKTAQSVVFHKH